MQQTGGLLGGWRVSGEDRIKGKPNAWIGDPRIAHSGRLAKPAQPAPPARPAKHYDCRFAYRSNPEMLQQPHFALNSLIVSFENT
jgi:hypothetical protein